MGIKSTVTHVQKRYPMLLTNIKRNVVVLGIARGEDGIVGMVVAVTGETNLHVGDYSEDWDSNELTTCKMSVVLENE